jgi:hypothetical protein
MLVLVIILSLLLAFSVGININAYLVFKQVNRYLAGTGTGVGCKVRLPGLSSKTWVPGDKKTTSNYVCEEAE